MCQRLFIALSLSVLFLVPCFSEDFILVSVSDLRALWTTQQNYERLTESFGKVTDASGINLTKLGQLLIESNETNESLTLNLQEADLRSQKAEKKAADLESNLQTLKPQLESSQAEVKRQEDLLKSSDVKIDSLDRSLKSTRFWMEVAKWSAIVAGTAAIVEGFVIAAK
jgi:septal ring factor EnvC (AmiA/AmiB activator)